MFVRVRSKNAYTFIRLQISNEFPVKMVHILDFVVGSYLCFGNLSTLGMRLSFEIVGRVDILDPSYAIGTLWKPQIFEQRLRNYVDIFSMASI